MPGKHHMRLSGVISIENSPDQKKRGTLAAGLEASVMHQAVPKSPKRKERRRQPHNPGL